jgi:hypothetical protein
VNQPTHLHSIFNNVKKLQGFGYPQIWDSGSELLGMMMKMTMIPPKLLKPHRLLLRALGFGVSTV